MLDVLRIAIIDDGEDLREALCELLQASGFSCCSFPDGAAFLQMPDCMKYGCILADLRMPGLGGMELQAALGQRGLRMPLIIMTSHISAHAKAQALMAGALAVLSKPLSAHELLPLIEDALARAGTYRSTEGQ